LSSFAVEHLLLLPLGVAAALVWSNAGAESYYRFTYSIAFAVNNVAMALFFAIMTKEVVEATAVGGVLHPWRRAALPVASSLGVIAAPALVYLAALRILDEPMLRIGWLIPSAIDMAVGYFIARLIFRPRHPAIPFMLLLAIATNAISLAMLGLIFQAREVSVVVFAVLLAPALAAASLLRRARVRSFWPYLVIGGALSWSAFYWGGVHPALALVPIVPFMPHAARDPGFFVDARPGAPDTLSRFENVWRYPVHLALFFFGLVNAGVPVGALEAGVWAVPIATLAGKPLGLLAAAGLAVAAGLHLPQRVGWRELLVVGLITTIGFGAALFLAAVVLGPGQLLSEIRMGVLVGLAGAPAALAVARVLRVGRFARSA
jgi:NhaA family Na+:H+ antiporter